MRNNLYTKNYKNAEKINSKYNVQNLYLIFEKAREITPISFLISDNEEIYRDFFSIYKNLKIIYYHNDGYVKNGIVPRFRYDLSLDGKIILLTNKYKKIPNLKNFYNFEDFINKSIISLKENKKINFKTHFFSSKNEKKYKFIFQSNIITEFFVFNLDFSNFLIL